MSKEQTFDLLTNNAFNAHQLRVINYLYFKKRKEAINLSDIAKQLKISPQKTLNEINKIQHDFITLITNKEKVLIKINNTQIEINIDNKQKINKGIILSTNPNDIEEIFNYWKKECLILSNVKLSEKRKELISNRLKKYSVNDLKLAIKGVSRTLWNMGYDNKTGEKTNTYYNDLDTIFRLSKIDKYIESSDKPTIEEQLKLLNNPNQNDSTEDWLAKRQELFK